MTGLTSRPDTAQGLPPQGIRVHVQGADQARLTQQDVLQVLHASDLASQVTSHWISDASGHCLDLQLNEQASQAWAPGYDTLCLCEKLKLDPQNNTDDLRREIVLALLMSPLRFEFPSLAELNSAVRIRLNIVQAAHKTMLAFHTEEAERPPQSWTYQPDSGFILLPGASLISALTQATQPGATGELYAFSCYRATEYLILLGIAQELQTCNPALFEQLQTQ
jgi:hypothetical protein